MASSQERQPTLDAVAPRFLVGEMEQALAFYGQLGFVRITSREIVPMGRIFPYFSVHARARTPLAVAFVCISGNGQGAFLVAARVRFLVKPLSSFASSWSEIAAP